jgi:excisionase family DNA binding protein
MGESLPRRSQRVGANFYPRVLMGVSPWFVEQEIRAGRLPALKLCRHYTLLKEDLDAYLDDAKQKAA